MLLSRLGYYSDFFIYPLLIVVLGAAGLVQAGTGRTAEWIAILLACLAGWTLLEYSMHRFVLHRVPYLREQHARHHDEERSMIGTPTWLSLGSHVAFAFVPVLIATDFATASAVSCGLMLGYFWYISVHHIVHNWHPASHAGYLYGLKRRHAMHHHFDEAGNFGVTTDFWDRVFGTVRVPDSAADRFHGRA